MTKAKSYVRLMSSVSIKKKYNSFTIYTYDEGVYEYSLSEWRINKDPEWVQVEKLDNTEMNIFSISNVVRVKFSCGLKQKGIATVKSSLLKPVV